MAAQDIAREDVLKKIEMYRHSIIHAESPELAATVWGATPEASFIHPRGHERGWDAIRENFYHKTMVRLFSRRELRLTSAPVIHIYGDAAVAEFDWEFTARTRDNDTERRTSGRESQVYARRSTEDWRLVHVHYSGPAVTA